MSDDDKLIDDLAKLSRSPLQFVQWAFPWGESGTELADCTGPEEWQSEILAAVGNGLLSLQEAVQIAVSSGHGIGKTALVSWMILWAISTFEDTRGVVTANTETQLKTKTWAELAKWHRLFIARHLFKLTATGVFSADPIREKTWRIDQVPWSERNMEAFAGLHNQDKRIIVVMDEASAIPDVIWETTEGALTDKPPTQIIWACFGNPTKNTGRFRECFRKYAHRWRTWSIDSREVTLTNKKQLQKWVDDYGEDSDFTRIRVKGAFPRAGNVQFIPTDLVEGAMQREAEALLTDPLLIGVDVARFGDDASVIAFRKGRDGRTHPPIKLRGVDTMALAARVADEFERYHADGIFVDGGGIGAGVVDRLRQLRVPVIEVQFGGAPDRVSPDGDEEYSVCANKRAEMWNNMKRWLRGGSLPDDGQLKSDLIGVEFGYRERDQAILLESKADMKRRGLDSPDIGDAYALTFAYPVQPSEAAGRPGPKEPLYKSEYDPFDVKYLEEAA